jgi:hypothetical protein
MAALKLESKGAGFCVCCDKPIKRVTASGRAPLLCKSRECVRAYNRAYVADRWVAGYRWIAADDKRLQAVLSK